MIVLSRICLLQDGHVMIGSTDCPASGGDDDVIATALPLYPRAGDEKVAARR
jgi:hypothetical protein